MTGRELEQTQRLGAGGDLRQPIAALQRRQRVGDVGGETDGAPRIEDVVARVVLEAEAAAGAPAALRCLAQAGAERRIQERGGDAGADQRVQVVAVRLPAEAVAGIDGAADPAGLVVESDDLEVVTQVVLRLGEHADRLE